MEDYTLRVHGFDLKLQSLFLHCYYKKDFRILYLKVGIQILNSRQLIFHSNTYTTFKMIYDKAEGKNDSERTASSPGCTH